MISKKYDTIITPGKTIGNYWKDFILHKELIYILALRDFKVKYKQTAIGVVWTLIQPLLMMIIFVFIFSNIAQLPSEGSTPYPILVFAGLLPWQFFSNAVRESSNSLIQNTQLITKVYFPRLIIPASSVMVPLLDMLIAFGILAIIMIIYSFVPDWNIVLLPLAIIWVYVLSLGTGILFASYNVKYRDVRYIIPFILQIGFFISPVGYSSNVIPKKYDTLYALNPMVGVIELFRKSIIGASADISFQHLLTSAIFTGLILIIAIRHFRKTENYFADII